MNSKKSKIIGNSVLYVDPSFYTELPDEDKPMTPDEEAKFMENIDMEEIDRTIAYLETQEDNPDAWVSWEEVVKSLKEICPDE